MNEEKKFEADVLENILGLDSVFEDSNQDRPDFFDDMVAHILVGGFRFCIDIKKENDHEVKKARKWLLNKFEECDIVICSICGKLIEGIDANNAKPFNNGECCGKCNREKVIPLRLK